MTEMLLFGAGASVEANVPTANDLTRSISKEFRRLPQLERHSRVVDFVLGGLLFNKGIHGADPLNSGINVEEFFNAVQLLADRNTLEAAPFVGSWHNMVEEFDKVKPPVRHAEKLQEIIFQSVADTIFSSIPSRFPEFRIQTSSRSSIGDAHDVARSAGRFVEEILKLWAENIKNARPASGYDFEQEFKQVIDQQSRPGEGRIFREVAEEMIRMLVKFVFVQDASLVDYLNPIRKIIAGQPRLAIASLNYDNCVELFCDNAGLRCDTGIDAWSKSGTFEMEGAGVLLLKLHGSIDWKSDEALPRDGQMPQRVITRLPPDKVRIEAYWPAVIFGHKNKLTAEGPFLDLLRAFKSELAAADRLTVVGYSFADIHINVYLSHWLNSRSEHRLRIVDPHFDRNANDYAKELRRHAKKQIEIIKQPAGEALEMLFG